MKRILIIAAFGLALCLSSCEDDWSGMFNKVSYTAFLHNETSQNVTLTYRYGYGCEQDSVRTFYVPAGQELEISDGDCWSFTRHAFPEDSAVFQFEDGFRMVQSYRYEYHDDGTADLRFAPELNNIFSGDVEAHPGWTLTKLKGNKMRHDFYIRR